MKWITKNKTLCLYYTLDDELFEIVSNKPDYFFDRELLKRCDEAKGKHFHAVLFINNKEIMTMRNELKKLKKKYKTISFWNREHKKLRLWRGECV
jgi:hypothetical protein